MREYLNSYKVHMKLLLLAAVLLAACSEDSESSGETDLLQLVPYSYEMADAEPAATRAIRLPSGYTEYSGSNTIGVYTTTTESADAPALRTFSYSYKNNSWTSRVSVTNTKQYYIYGYMPVNSDISCEVSQLSETENYAKGAVLNFTGLPPVMAEDFSVITGVLQVPNADPAEDFLLTAGKFGYVGRPSGENYVCMTLDHLYSSVMFNFKVNGTYDKLRTIRLTKVRLKSESQVSYPLTVTLRDKDVYTGQQSCTVKFGDYTSLNNDFVTLFTDEKADALTLSANDVKEVEGFIVPQPDVAGTLVLECTYDVYDKDVTEQHPEGNLVREGCKAINTLPASSVTYGDNRRTVLTLTVNPTYLYQLSEPDLDNPTVKVE